VDATMQNGNSGAFGRAVVASWNAIDPNDDARLLDCLAAMSPAELEQEASAAITNIAWWLHVHSSIVALHQQGEAA